MRNIFFILITIWLGLAACSRKQEATAPTEITAAEDSAYQKVLQVETARTHTYFSKMNEVQLDSLIPLLRQAEAHYKDGKNADMKLRIYRFFGEMLWEKGRYTESVDYFMNAYEQAGLVDSLDTKRTIASQMAFRLIPSTTINGDSVDSALWKEHPELEALTYRVLERLSHEPHSVQLSLLAGLQRYYETIGDKEKALWCAHRKVATQEKTIRSEYTGCIIIGSAHARVGNQDSASYYRTKADSISKALDKKYPHRAWMHMDEEPFPWELIATLAMVGLLAVAAGIFVYYRKRLHKQQEELQQAKEEVERLTPGEDVFVKIEQIIDWHLRTAHSSLRMEKQDWHLLLIETDKRFDGVVSRLQRQYGLSEEEVHLCCLQLTDYPISHLGYVLGCSRVSIYRKSKEIVTRMGGDESVTLRDFLKKEVMIHD